MATNENASDRKTASIEQEPEYVGVHSGIVNDTCQQWNGDDPKRCGKRATHTKIMYSGRLHELAVCDDCGVPEDLPDTDREWSGQTDSDLPTIDGPEVGEP